MSWLFTPLQPDGENDSSFLSQTLTRQLRGVATFLAPPPPSSSSSDSPPPSLALLGVRNDLAEFGGSLKTGLSLLSVAGISKLASNLLPVRNRDGGGSVPGITDEILGFVAEISKLPDCWTGFPIPLDHHDFSMSSAQREHASAVEELVPEFVELRVRVCGSMSKDQFWMIYFLLLLPRINADDFELLSTPKIVEARDALLHKLQKDTQVSEESTLDSTEKDTLVEKTQGEKVSSLEKKDLTEIVNTAERLRIDDEESTEQWSEEASISSGTFVDDPKKLEHEDDISFSDLEGNESDISSRSSGLRPAQAIRGCSPSGSNDWVRLNRSSAIGSGHQRTGTLKEKDSEGEESNDWLTVDKFD
ncbi:PREDICTED: uncharacterized protein LOC101309188 [Fragaria vesca subsp. vesca]|uniref:uncharacterized protein LOC101309188 n=1 Tax=Fragaria vesca subsp. vesca TaxID=101020 RepID=UPI0002C3204E|nr:PREDICTED: uncharacterized protein LOC101309188 [Fragaria vesca subsp. vesca]